MKESATGLRFRVLVVVLVAITPALAVIVFSGLEQRRSAAATAREEAERIVRLAAHSVGGLVEGGRELLTALSQFRAVRSGHSEDCTELLADLLGRFPQYTNLGVADLDGNVLCSGLPLPGPVNISDRAYFRRALAADGFAAGDYQVGRITRRAAVNFGLPVQTEDGSIQGVVYAALDLGELNRLAAAAGIPAGAAISIFDDQGRILARHPDPERWVGRILTDTELVRAARASGSGTFQGEGLDGRQRLYAFTELDSISGRVHVTMGLPADQAYAPAARSLRRNLVALGIAAALALGLAWMVGQAFIVRRTRRLLEASRRLAEGDLGARTGLAHDLDEIGQLARAFDEMADSLEGRQGQAQEAEAALRAGMDVLRATDRERRELLGRLDRAQEEERKRIAEDIHDDSLQVMAAVGMRLETLAGQIADPDHRRAVDKLHDVVGATMARLRRLMFELNPPVLEREGLAAALRTYVTHAFADHEVSCRVESRLAQEPPLQVRTSLYRITQEALTNVRKHAEAASVTVLLEDRDGGILARIEDDGVGVPSSVAEAGKPGHFGLVTMRERAEMAGGWSRLRSAGGAGTVVEVWVPVPADRALRVP